MDLYRTNELKKQRIVILDENYSMVPNKINEIKIKNMIINIKREPLSFTYKIYNKGKNNIYEELLEETIKIDFYDDIWLVKEYNYFIIKRNSINSIYLNIIYKNNFKTNKRKNTDIYLKYKINDNDYSNYIRSINVIHNLTNLKGYIKIFLLTQNNINNTIIYDIKGDANTTYLYNIKEIEDNNCYDIKPIENKTKIKGDFTIRILNKDNEKIKFNYIYIYEYDIDYNI